MKYVDEFRDSRAGRKLVAEIREAAPHRPLTLMEVCGTHTMAIARFGIRPLLPPSIRLISGPGCPVCVTPLKFMDTAVALSRQGLTLAVFGDMMRVPGSASSLEREAASGADVRVVASTLEALALADRLKPRPVVFLGIGFETTAPTVAASMLEAKRRSLANYTVLCGHKTMPRALAALAAGNPRPDGYLCPGHVSVVIGSGAYEGIVRDFGIGCVIAGFEPLDILQAIRMLVIQFKSGAPAVENPYSRAVTAGGNGRAREVMETVFEPCDSDWRGLGRIQGSGLSIRPEFADFDAAVRFPVSVATASDPPGCRCGEVLTGAVRPAECGLFGTACAPDHPVGACMVSSEGTCAAAYRYGTD
ncbi:hydrogenase formation protein HypD [bacterium]|nr:hydrogenase formation protein HypD [bacterium]